jgi:acyl carrier protein
MGMPEADSVRAAIARFLGREPDALLPEQELKELVAESFVLVELVVELQEVFDVQLQGRDLEGVRTVRQLVEVVQRAAR